MQAIPNRAAWLTVVWAVGLGLLSACTRDHPPDKPASASSIQKEASSGKTFVTVDYEYAEPGKLAVDGEPWVDLAPYSVTGLELSTGGHEFVVTSGGREVDRIEAKLKAFKTTAVNVGGRAAYDLTTYTYTTGSPLMPGTGPSGNRVSGERRVEADFGLLQVLPATILIQQDAPLPFFGGAFSVRTDTRTKLKKLAPEGEMPVAQAIAIIRQPMPYYIGAVNGAFQTLASHTADPGVREVLMEGLVSDNGAIVQGSFGSLGPLAADIPDETLVSWLSVRPAEKDEAGAAADRERLKGAARILAARADGGLLLNHFAQIDAGNQQVLVREMASSPKVSAALRRHMIATALKDWPRKEAIWLHSVLQSSGGLEVDELFAVEVDRFVAGLEDEKDRKLWNGVWQLRLARDSGSMTNDWIGPRLAAWVKEPLPANFNVRNDLARALIDRDEADQIVGLLDLFETVDRRNLIRYLAVHCRNRKEMSPASLQLALRALHDTEPEVRKEGFMVVASHGADVPELREELKAALNRESDSSVRSGMEDQLTGSMSKRFQNAGINELMEIVVSAPTRPLVGRAMDKLLFNTARDQHLTAIGKNFAAIRSSANRTWILQELGRFERFRATPEYATQYDSLVTRGMGDADHGVRSAAMQAKASTVDDPLGPEADKLLSQIMAQHDPALRQDMLGGYHAAMVEALGKIAGGSSGGRERRDQAVGKLLSIAATAGDETSLLALGKLRTLYQVEDVPKLVAVYRHASGAELKKKVISITGVNNDEALAGALPVFELGLSDPDPGVRLHAFTTLNKWVSPRAGSRQKLASMMKAVVAREEDEETRQQMEKAAKWLKTM